jgi:DNA repair exonuclease SbcCD nuclease subunit
MHGLAAYPDAPAAELRNATRAAFVELVRTAIEERVDFLIIAGDLYDGTWRDHNTGIFFCKEMGRLKRAGIPVFLVYGNHDAESEMTKKLDLPDNVRAFGASKPEVIRLDTLKVALHGQSFRNKETTSNLAATYPAPVAGFYNIGVLHTALEGHAQHASYAPCTIDELHARGYQYWALGHVHEFKQWAGASTIVFPGNLQGRNVRETGRRGAVLVSVNEDGATSVERLFIDVLRWEAVTVDASNATSLLEVARCIGGQLEGLLGIDPQVPRAVRVTVVGRTHAHGELFGLEAQLRQEVLAHVATLGNDRLWLERVQLQTGPPEVQAAAARTEAVTDLSELLQEAQQDAAFRQQLRDDLAPFVAKIPLDLQLLVPAISQLRTGNVEALIDAVSPGLLAQLAATE